MRIIKAGAKLAAFLLIFVLLSWVCLMLLDSPDSQDDQMWHDFYKETQLDTVFAGTSECQYSICPDIVDGVLGSRSFNMGTQAQSLDMSYSAIEAALNRHEIKNAVLCMSYSTLGDLEIDSVIASFYHAQRRYAPFTDRLRIDAKYVFGERNIGERQSLDYFVPWVYDNVGLSPYSVVANARRRAEVIREYGLSGGQLDDSIVDIADGARGYRGRGFWYMNFRMGYNDYDGVVSAETYSRVFSGESFGQLDRIAALCAERGVRLTVVATPHPAFDVISYGSEYFDKMQEVSAFLSERGADYFDFNLARPELFTYDESYFWNFEHMNYDGAAAFSESLGRLLAGLNAGTDMCGFFYGPEEYLASVSFIAMIQETLEQTDGGIMIRTVPWTGSEVDAEYKMTWVNSDSGEEQAIREYDRSPDFFWERTEPGTYSINVYARVVGSENDFDRYDNEVITID